MLQAIMNTAKAGAVIYCLRQFEKPKLADKGQR